MSRILFFALVALSICVGCAKRAWSAEVGDSPSVPILTVAPMEPQVSVPLYSQLDRRWAYVRLGPSTRTMKQSGCLATSVAIANALAGGTLNPLQVVRALTFNTRGELIWNLPSTLSIALADRIALGRGTAVALINRELRNGMFVLLKLGHSASGKRGQHWVVATGGTNTDVFVIDPVHGAGSLNDMYGRVAVSEMVVLQKQ